MKNVRKHPPREGFLRVRSFDDFTRRKTETTTESWYDKERGKGVRDTVNLGPTDVILIRRPLEGKDRRLRLGGFRDVLKYCLCQEHFLGKKNDSFVRLGNENETRRPLVVR